MIRPVLLSTLSLALMSSAAPAKAPPFDTGARVAYLIDLSSGAVLLDKNADQRMPPASMAKMMTTNVAFELIDKGDLTLDKMCTVRPETWQKWHGPQAGSTMFLSPNEQVSVENLLHGIVTLSGNDASVVLAECIAGTEEAFANVMNENAKRLGLTNSHFGNSNGWPDEGRTYVTARDLATLARAEIENHPKLYKKFYGQRDFTWGKTLGCGPGHHPGQPQPVARQGPGRRRPQDRPHRRGRLWLHRIGRAERPPPDHGRRRARQLQPADQRIGPADGMGLQRLADQAAVQGGGHGRHRPGPAGQRERSRAGRPARLWR